MSFAAKRGALMMIESLKGLMKTCALPNGGSPPPGTRRYFTSAQKRNRPQSKRETTAPWTVFEF
jgi:hypothetical protein